MLFITYMNIAFNNIASCNQYTPVKYTGVCFKAQPPDKFIRSGLRVIANDGRSNGVMVETPMPICDFLHELCNINMFKNRQNELKIYKDSLAASPLRELKIKQLIGYGSSAIALETTNNKVLKLTRSNHFPMNRPVEDFDAEVYTRGRIGNMYYYVAEKCTPCESGWGYADTMREKIRQKGYRPSDLGSWDDFQVGFNSKCQLKLLDPECAKYKTPIHRLIQVVKNLFEK